MKKIFSILFALLLVASVALAADVAVTKDMPNTIGPNEVLTVTFTIKPGTEAITNFDLAELLPQGWTVSEWSVTGIAKDDVTFDAQDQTWREATYSGNHWEFDEISSDVTVTYKTTTGSEAEYNIIAIWTWPGGYDKAERELTVGTPTGDETPTPPPSTTPTDTTPTETTTPTEQPMDWTWIIVGIVIVVIIIGAVYYFNAKK